MIENMNEFLFQNKNYYKIVFLGVYTHDYIITLKNPNGFVFFFKILSQMMFSFGMSLSSLTSLVKKLDIFISKD